MTGTGPQRVGTGRLGDLGRLTDVEGVSCAPDRLYAAGGHYDTDVSLQRLREIAAERRPSFEVVDEIYPAETASRPSAIRLDSANDGFLVELRKSHAALDAAFPVLPPSLLVRVRDAAVWDNMVFVLQGGSYEPVYEWYRASDRLLKATGQASRIRKARLGARQRRSDTAHLFLGSVGSSVYGHWITDDLPLLKALRPLRRLHERVRVVMTSLSDSMNAVRADSLAALTRGVDDVDWTFQRGTTIQPYDELYVVSPASSPPMLKSREAMAFLRSAPAVRTPEPVEGQGGIFVHRSAIYGRHLANGGEIARRLGALGFRDVSPEHMPVGEQWRTFGASRAVVGVMGSAMANTAFSPAGCAVLHLAPEGWAEPFFWDLAGACGHDYAVQYGSAPNPIDGSFSVDADVVVRQAQAMLARR